MALVDDFDTSDVIDIEECERLLLKNVDFDDVDSVRDGGKYLRRLANDRTFVLNMYNEKLKNLSVGQNGSFFSPQSSVLRGNKVFYFRTNIWLPPSPHPNLRAVETELFTYDTAHDHNFTLMSVGYFGSGYVTDTFEYDHSKVTGVVGEPVEITSLGSVQLEPGKSIVYRPSEDIHIQHEPTDPSVSLNVMIYPRKKVKQQFLFDVKQNRLVGGVEDEISSRLYLMDIVDNFSDENTLDIVSNIVKTCECPRSQARAFQTLVKLLPEEAEGYRGYLSAEARSYVKHRLANIEVKWGERLV